jgi:hypothetical protein
LPFFFFFENYKFYKIYNFNVKKKNKIKLLKYN